MSKSSGKTAALKKLRGSHEAKKEKVAAKSSKDKKTISSVLIKVCQEKSYADVLKKVRKRVKPDVSRSRVVSARALQEGVFLILLDNGSNMEAFTAEVRRVVKGLEEVRDDPKKVTRSPPRKR